MDCVLGYHLNPMTCGIAKFNYRLARELNVPILNVFSPEAREFMNPLLSIKTVEFNDMDLLALRAYVDTLGPGRSLDLFLHAYDDTDLERHLVNSAGVVYCGNVELYKKLRPYGEKVKQAWCPGTLLDDSPFRDVDLSVFTFGMAHKMRPDYYHKLDALLRATGKTYCFYVSTALHEGTTFEDDFLEVFEEMKAMFSGNVYFLGFLSDTAVYNYLKNTTYYAAFFGKGVRANNTSVNTALALGATIITNLDEDSPELYRHMETVVDINTCDELPADPAVIERIGENARQASDQVGWARLVSLLSEGGEQFTDESAAGSNG